MNVPVTKESLFPKLPPISEVGDTDDKQKTEDEVLLGMLSGLGEDADAMVRIYRVAQGKLSFVAEVVPAAFSLPMLQKEPYNGGDFRVHVRNRTGLIGNRLVSVEPLPVKSLAASPAPDLSAVMAPIQTQITQLAGIVKDLAGMVQASQKAAPTEMEMLEKMKLYKDLFGVGNAAPAVDPFEMVGKVIEMSKSLNSMGGGGEPPDALSVIMRAAEMFKGPITMAFENQARAQQAVQQPQPAAASATPAIGPTASPVSASAPAAPTESDQANMLTMMKMYFGKLIEKAANDSDPTGYAHLIIDNADDATIDSLLRPDNWMDNLAAIDDRVRQYPDWFAELRAMIFELLTLEQDSSKTVVVEPHLRGNEAQQPTGPISTDVSKRDSTT